MKHLFLFIGLLFLTALVHGQEIDISLGDASVLQIDPGSHSTLSFRVKNLSSRNYDLIPVLELPEGWKIIIADNNFSLVSDSEEVRFLSILVPGKYLAGTYTVAYALQDVDGLEISRFEFPVEVLPRISLALELLEAPNYVVAGEEYKVSYILYNQGNQATTIEYDVNSGELLAYLITNTQEIYPPILEPGSSIGIDIKVLTPSRLFKMISHRLELRIPYPKKMIPPNGKEALQGVTYVEIIPQISAKGDVFFTIPAILNQSLTGQLFMENSVQSESVFEMAGPLDENNFHTIDLFAKKKMDSVNHDFQRILVDPDDEYRVEYKNPNFTLLLGDNGYSLTPLLEEYRFGRGVESRFYFGPFQVGGYYHQNFGEDPLAHNGAAFFQWMLPNDMIKEGATYRVQSSLHTTDARNLVTGVYQEWNPIDEINITGDAAISFNPETQIAPAFMLKGQGEHEWGGYHFDFHYADPFFTGFYKDQYFLLTSASVNLLENQLRLYGGYQIEEKNLLRNPDKKSAMHENTLIGSFNFAYLPWNFNIYGNYKNRNRLDLFENPEYDDWENALNLNYRQNFDELRFNFASEISHTLKSISNDTILKQKYLTGFGFKPNKQFDSSFSLHYQNESPSNYSSSHVLGWSFNMIYENNGILIEADAKNHFVLRNNVFSGVAFSISTGTEWELMKNHVLEFDVNYLLSNNYDEWTNNLVVKAAYTLPLAIPLGQKTNIGSLRGQLYDDQNGEFMEGVVIRTGGQAVITDEKGQFRFSGLKPGEYFVTIDRGRLGKNQIPKMETPIRVTITRGQETWLKIPVTLGSRISGSVNIYDFNDGYNNFAISEEEGEQAAELVQRGGISQLILELSNGEETKRRVTDSHGRFEFEELYSGTWNLTVLRANLPDYHYFEKSNYQIELDVDEHLNIEIRVLPEQRAIQMIDDLSVEPLEITDPSAQ